ncbi:nitroreductase family deazaflavin-dependent oxidoreductase [Actinomadura sp. CNU-125]|uniref:nitroreductase family deazaflavin-dependent oxidoreductase n=1 Tax=Actinomadura sp. CNU-125 TaxID=1904961 RepID=UPI0029162892|nr:nitroreductase family deazaflavin-dependent oxidoreductase [Actinomadura sp. CNU-125]
MQWLDSAFGAKAMKALSRAHVELYRVTDGRLGATWRFGAAFPGGVPVCLLTTRGRKTGRERTLPLVCMPDGDRVLLVASQGGLPRHPLWYLNLCADPRVVVRLRGDVRRMRARAAAPDERAELWPRVVAFYADYGNYQSWTDREIPVVVCEPA